MQVLPFGNLTDLTCLAEKKTPTKGGSWELDLDTQKQSLVSI
jgi:hypothetical protein